MIVGLTFQRGLYGKKGAMRRSIRSTLSAATSSGAPVRRSVTVVLLNKEELQILVESKGKVADIFNQVCDHLGLRETEYFSLAQHVDGEYHFVDLDQKVSKLAPKAWRSHHNNDLPVTVLYFRVQFYVDHVMLLRERVTRHQYYLQLRDNMVQANQLCAEERCFLLAAYALQADLGSYNTHKHARSYFDPREYFPAWVISKHGSEYIVTSMPAMHSDLSGMTKMEAQMHYIKDVSASPAAHNLHFYRLKKRKIDPLGTAWLGICPKGIEIYEERDEGFKSLLSTFVWSSIGKLYFEKKKFEIRAVGCPTGRKFTYYTGSDERSKYLLQLCRATHLFQITVQPKLAEIRHLEAEDKRRFRESHREAYIYSDRRELDRDQGRGSTSWSGKFSQGSSQINGLTSTPGGSLMDQRVSVISNTSSNTTSGIVSDRMYQSFDDSEDDMRHTEIMIDSPPNHLAGYIYPGSFKMPNARSTPLHLVQGKAHGISSSPASLNRMGDFPHHTCPSASHSYSIVSRSSSGHSQRSGKLTLSPTANIPEVPNPPPSLPRPMPIPAEVQIQRISLAPTMTVNSTKVPSSAGPVFSGVATTGSPSLPTYVNVPAMHATYVNVSEIMGSGHYVQPLTTAPPPPPHVVTTPNNYPTSMVGQTFVAESRPLQQMATPAVPSNIYSSVANNGSFRQPVTMSMPTAYTMNENLPVVSYGTAEPVMQTMLGPSYGLPASGPTGPTVDYTTHRSSTPPNYPLKVLSVSTNPPMLVSSHPHVPAGVLPQQCLPVEPRVQIPPPQQQQQQPPPQPPPQQQTQQQQQQETPPHSQPPHISQQGPPLTPHLHHSAIQATQNPGLTATMVNPPMCPQPASPATLIPPTTHIPKLVVTSQPSPSALQRSPTLPSPQQMSPSSGSMNSSPSAPSSQPPTPPVALAAPTVPHPLSVIDHTVTVDDTTAGPSTPLTVLPPPPPPAPPSTSQTPVLPAPPTTVVTPPEGSPETEAEVTNKPPPPAPSPAARGQRGGLVPTGEFWGYIEGNPRAAARHHSMGKFDQLLSPNASRDSEARRRGRRSKTCPVHGVMQDVAAELQVLTNKNHSLPLLSALCSDSSLIQQVQEKCSCSSTNSQNTSHDDKSSSGTSISQMGTMITNEPGTVIRPVSWHSATFNLDQTLKLLKDEERYQNTAGSGASPVSQCKGSQGKRSNSDDGYTPRRPHSDELASLTQSQLKAAPLIAGLLAPGRHHGNMLEASVITTPNTTTSPHLKKYTNHSGAMFPSKLTSGGHSPNSSETLHQQASMGLA